MRKIRLKGVSFSNSAFSVRGTLPGSIAAGKSVNITVQANATADPQHLLESTITVKTNAVVKTKQEYRFLLVTDNPVLPIPQIDLQGVNAGSETSLGSKLQDDGAVSRVFVIKNTGVGELIVNKIGVADKRFIISDLSRKNIPAGQTATFRVSLPSNALGVYSTNLNINSNAANLPNYTIRLKATILKRQPKIDIAEVKANSSIDLGVVKKGAPELRREFSIRNTGTANLELKAPAISSSAFKVTDVGRRILKPGEQTTFFVTLSTASPSTYSGYVNVGSNDTSNRNYSFQVKALVSSTASKLTIDGWNVNQQIDMGTTYLGERALTRTFTIRNTGDAILNIQSVAMDYSLMTIGQPASLNLAPGATTTFTVTLDPAKVKELKTVTGVVRVRSTGGNLSFSVLGKIDGKATATVDGVADNGTFNFGSTTKGGATITKTFTIRNTGTKTLFVNRYKSSSPEFTVKALSANVAVGRTHTFSVTMKAGASGSPTGLITIETDDAANPVYAINVRGTVMTDVHTTHYVSMTGGGSVTDPASGRNIGFVRQDVLKIEEFDDGRAKISMFFEGSQHGLTSYGEDIDAFTIHDGKLIMSVVGYAEVPGGLTAERNDLLAFDPRTNRWSKVFDGDDNGLYGGWGGGNIDAVFVHDGGYAMSIGAQRVGDVIAAPEDIILFKDGKWSMLFDGRDSQIYGGNVDGAAAIPGGFSVSLNVGLGLGTAGYAFRASTVDVIGSPARPQRVGFDSDRHGFGSYDIDAYHVEFRPAAKSFGDTAAAKVSARSYSSVVLDDERDDLFAEVAVFGL